jgi:hypothetical protein
VEKMQHRRRRNVERIKTTMLIRKDLMILIRQMIRVQMENQVKKNQARNQVKKQVASSQAQVQRIQVQM